MNEIKYYEGFINVIDEYDPGDGLILSENNNVNRLDEKLAELIQEDIKEYGNFLSVKYYISKNKTDIDTVKKEHIIFVSGISTVEYFDSYSDYTGYLYTSEEIMIGGHDLLEELANNKGKYVFLEITYSESDKE